MRKNIIAGNWKMNMTKSETSLMLKELVSKNLNKDVEKIIFPPFTSIDKALEILKNSDIKIGAQNLSQFEKGAYTGEISAQMLIDLGVDHVLIGHSERRIIFNETDEIINNKIKIALKNDLKVILCVGEPQEIRDNHKEEDFIKNQLNKSLKDIAVDKDLIIAYEPIWAIGTGNTCDPQDAEKICKFIRDYIKDISNEKTSNQIRVLYGGSVKPDNIAEIMQKENIDGALVGGASLNSDDFSKLINYEVKI